MAKKPSSPLVPARVAKSLWSRISVEQWLAVLHEALPDGQWKPRGRHVTGRCVDPHHADGKPSMYVTPSKGLAKCFSCTGRGTWMDPIALVATAKRASYVDAAKFLRRRFKLKDLIPDDQIARLDKEDAAANRRTLAAKVMCEALREAIAHRGDPAWDWSAPSVAWLASRQFGGNLDAAPWPRLTSAQLIGLVPPMAYVANRYGDVSAEYRACSAVLDEYWSGHAHLGWLVFPWHAADGQVRRIKLRSHDPSLPKSDAIRTIEAKDASDLWPGAYGLRAASLGGETAPTGVLVVEGEPDALQFIASADTWPGIDIIALGGGSAPSLDPLAPLGLERALVIQDDDAGGSKFVEQLADQTTAVSLRPMQWPDAWSGNKDLDDVIKANGYPCAASEVTTIEGIARNFVGVGAWCATRAIAEAERRLDDPEAQGKIACKWGERVQDPHERMAYVRDVATQLGLDGPTLARELGESRGIVVVSDDAPRALAVAWTETVPPIVRWAGAWWSWCEAVGCYGELAEVEALRPQLWRFLSRVSIERGDEALPLRVKGSLVSDVIDALISVVHVVPVEATLPHALPGYAGPDLRGVAVVRNGLVELASGTLHPPTATVFATAAADVRYDPAATCPTWERFLGEIFEDDAEAVDLTRQMFGWLVSGDVSRHVIALIIGPPRSGKGTMLTALRALLGEANVCSSTLVGLAESRFGLAPMLGKTCAIFPDERLGSADQARLASALLAVSGGDTVPVERKGRDVMSVRLRVRLVVASNEEPAIGDTSGALASRFRVVRTRQSFLGREDRGLESRLRDELPGILRWAIEGWRDLEARGWVEPASAMDTMDDLARLGSPVVAFVDDCCTTDPVGLDPAGVSLDHLYFAWCAWSARSGRHAGTKERFSSGLRAAFPRLEVRRVRDDGRKERRVYGIAIMPGAIGVEGN